MVLRRLAPLQRRSVLCPCVVVLSLGLASETRSQTQEAPARDPRSKIIEEVIVTARRVEESLQDTPVSVAAFSSEELEQIGVSEPKDLAQYTPNLVIRNQSGSNDDYAIGLRGIAEAEPSLAIDPAVGLYIDGIYIARNVGLAFDITDLERIEVLRGPQGTLFGRNTIGGAVNIVTEKPRGELALKAQGAGGSKDYRRARISLDTPSIGDVALKFSLLHTARSGEVFSIYDGNDLGGAEALAYRAALRWTPSDRLMADYSHTRTKKKGNGQVSQLTHVRPIYSDSDSPLYGGRLYRQAAAIQSEHRVSERAMTRTAPEIDTSDIVGHALAFEWQALDNLVIKSISSYRTMDTSNFSEFHTFPVQQQGDVIDARNLETSGQVGLVPAGTFVSLFATPRNDWQRQLTQEFQFIGSLLDERLQFNTGVYYFQEDGFDDNPQEFALPTALVVSLTGQGAGLPAGLSDIVAAVVANEGTASATLLARPFQSGVDNKAYAAYADITWSVFADFDVTLGARYTVDERSASIRNIFDGEVKVLEGDDEWSNFNPGITFNYRWSPEISTYFKAATGYRSGGFNIRATTEESFKTPFDPEALTSYEFGIKSDLLDRSLRLNAALFQFIYEDRQIAQFEAGSGGASSRIENAGKSVTTGLELETVYAPIAGMKVIASFGYLDVEYLEYVTGPVDRVTGFPSAAVNQDISDVAASDLYAPKNTASFTVEHSFSPWHFGQLIVRASANYTDSISFHPQLNLFNRSAAHTTIDARVTLADMQAGEGHFSVSAWGKNLLNEEYRDFGIDFGLVGFAENTYANLASYGIDLVYSFNQ